MAWMARHESAAHRRTAVFTDVHGYLTWRLTGHFRTSWASADPLGLFDMRNRVWSEEILQALQVQPEQLPVAMAPGSVMGFVNAQAASDRRATRHLNTARARTVTPSGHRFRIGKAGVLGRMGGLGASD